MQTRANDLLDLRDLLYRRCRSIHGVLLFSREDTLQIISLVKKYRLQLLEVDCLHILEDGGIQPNFADNIAIWNHSFEETERRILELGTSAHFELLDFQDLLSSTES